MNKTIKRYIISTLITFATGFALYILPQIDSITLESFQNGAITGVIFAGVRAGIKAVFELFLNKENHSAKIN